MIDEDDSGVKNSELMNTKATVTGSSSSVFISDSRQTLPERVFANSGTMSRMAKRCTVLAQPQ